MPRSYQQSKSYCEDLTEGKFSFPIIYSILARPSDKRLLNILRQRTEDLDVKRHAVEYMKQCGALTFTREALRSLRCRIDAELAALGGHEQLSALLGKLDAQLDSEESGEQGQGQGQGGSAEGSPLVGRGGGRKAEDVDSIDTL